MTNPPIGWKVPDLLDFYIPDFSFSDELRQALLDAEYWDEKELKALCLGIPPRELRDTECCGTGAERNDVEDRIRAGINSGSGALYAIPKDNTYGPKWRIKPAHAVHWVMSQIPGFPKFPEWLASELQNQYLAEVAKRHAKGFCTLDEAARLIAEQEGWDEETQKNLLEQLMDDVSKERLAIRCPHTLKRIYPPTVRRFHEVVSQDDVNKGAIQDGVSWRLELTKPEPQAAPAAPETPAAPVVAVVASDAPTPQGNVIKKAALIAALKHEWPSIEADLSEATRNGLKDAAHAVKHSMWDMDKARAWAVSKGKIKQAVPTHSLAAAWSGPVTRHTPGD